MPEFLHHLHCAVAVLGILFTLPYAYRAILLLIGMWKTRVFPPAARQHRYGIVIAARNEEAVIGALLESIRHQDYPNELLTVFVVADHCTDRTAETAQAHGAVCYRRSSSGQRTKGYALQYLFACIERDYGTAQFDGFFVFDADNLLAPDYISRMNDAFDAGERIVTSCRNTKNFGENWIACTYGLHWLGTVRTEHRARSVLHLSTRLQGTGYLFDSDLVRDGWNYTSLTEDRELTADAVRRGWRVTYQGAAEFYDEQPTRARIALRQRMRWSRGHLETFRRAGGKIARELARRCFLPRRRQADPEGFRRARDVFICYDVLMTIFPEALLFALKNLLALGVGIAALAFSGFALPVFLAGLRRVGFALLCGYLTTLTLPLYIAWTERRRIPAMSVRTKALGICLWPVFPLIGNLTTVLALFRRVEWKPIPHHNYRPERAVKALPCRRSSGTSPSVPSWPIERQPSAGKHGARQTKENALK